MAVHRRVSFAAPVLAFKPLVYTPEFQLAEIKVEGKTYSDHPERYPV